MFNNRPRILLLDDDYESMFHLKDFLEAECGFQVELTADARVLQRLQAEKFDLIVLDIMIHPKSLNGNGNEVTNIHFDGVNWQQTGLVFLERLRNGAFSELGSQGTPPDVPVLALSAIADSSVTDMVRASTTITKYMEKPFDLDEVLTWINRLLAEPAL